MTSRERLMAAMKLQEVDRVPCSPRIHVWLNDYYGKKDWKTYLRAAKEFGFDPHIIVNSDVPIHVYSTGNSVEGLKDVRCQIMEKDSGGCTLVTRIFETPAGKLKEVIKVPKPGHREYGAGPNPVRVEHLVKDRSDLERLKYLIPDVSHFPVGKTYQELEKTVGEKALVQMLIYSALDLRAGEVRAMEDLMVDYYEDRVFLKELLSIFHTQVLAETRIALEKGCRHIFGSWYWSSMSAGWSPTIFKELFVPLIKEHVKLVHSYNGTYDYYDDGKCMEIVDILADCGIDVLETLTPPPVGDVDLRIVKQKIGDRVCLKGYVDLIYVIKMGTPELIDKTVKEAIEIAAPGGGFILGTSDSIRDGTPLENVKAYFNAAHKYRKLK